MRMNMTLALGTLVAVAIGTSAATLALFADQAGGEQEFEAGTLVLYGYRDFSDTVDGPMFYTTPEEGVSTGGLNGRRPTGLWAPGDSWKRALILRNDGSLEVKLTGLGADLESGSLDMAEKLTYVVSTDLNGTEKVTEGNLADLIASDVAFSTPLTITANPTASPGFRPRKQLYFHVTLPLEADNSLQGEELKVQFTVSAEQAKNN